MKRRGFGRATVGILIASLAGCSDSGKRGTSTPTRVETWGSFRGDDRRTGRVSAETGPGESVDIAWKLRGQDVLDYADPDGLSADSVVMSSRSSWPIVAEDLVIWKVTPTWLDEERRRQVAHYLVGTDASGSIEWVQKLTGDEGRLRFGPEFDGGVVYQPTMTDNGIGVAVIDPETGNRERTLDLGLPTATSLLVADGSIFAGAFGADDRRGLYAYDVDSGAEQWSVSATPYPQMIPFGALLDDTLLYFARGESATELVARDTSDGSVTWRTPFELANQSRLELPIYPAPPTVADEIYAAGSVNKLQYRDSSPLVSFDATDGTERFQYEPPGLDGTENPVLDWLAELNDEVPDADDLPPFSALYGLPLLVDDLVVATGYGATEDSDAIQHCYAIDRDGSLAWSIESDLAFAPVAAGDVIYLASWSEVTAVSSDGQKLDSVALGNDDGSSVRALFSPAIGHGRLYVPTDDGIVAIK